MQFWIEPPAWVSQNHTCFHWPNMPGNCEIMHCGILCIMSCSFEEKSAQFGIVKGRQMYTSTNICLLCMILHVHVFQQILVQTYQIRTMWMIQQELHHQNSASSILLLDYQRKVWYSLRSSLQYRSIFNHSNWASHGKVWCSLGSLNVLLINWQSQQ